MFFQEDIHFFIFSRGSPLSFVPAHVDGVCAAAACRAGVRDSGGRSSPPCFPEGDMSSEKPAPAPPAPAAPPPAPPGSAAALTDADRGAHPPPGSSAQQQQQQQVAAGASSGAAGERMVSAAGSMVLPAGVINPAVPIRNIQMKFAVLVGLIQVGEVSNRDIVETVLNLVSGAGGRARSRGARRPTEGPRPRCVIDDVVRRMMSCVGSEDRCGIFFFLFVVVVCFGLSLLSAKKEGKGIKTPVGE